MHCSSIPYLPSRTSFYQPRLNHHNTNIYRTSHSFSHHSRSTHCLSAYLFCRYTYYFTFKHKYYMNISDLPSDMPGLPSDLPTHNCYSCLNNRSTHAQSWSRSTLRPTLPSIHTHSLLRSILRSNRRFTRVHSLFLLFIRNYRFLH